VKFSDTATDADLYNSVAAGFLSGLTGNYIGNLMSTVSVNGFNAAINTALLSGSIDQLLAAGKKPFKDKKSDVCK